MGYMKEEKGVGLIGKVIREKCK